MVTAAIYSYQVTYTDVNNLEVAGILKWYWLADPNLLISNNFEQVEVADIYLAADDGTAGPSPVFFEV